MQTNSVDPSGLALTRKQLEVGAGPVPNYRKNLKSLFIISEEFSVLVSILFSFSIASNRK